MTQVLRDSTTGQQPRAYTVTDFAAAYGVGRTTIFEEIATGRLRTYKVGRRRYISSQAADQWQRAREAETAGAAA